MADPISLTAAAAGFIGLAGQLAQGIVKLKEIYTTLSDTPRNVANLCSSMDLLRDLLEGIGTQMQQPTYGNIDTQILRDVVNQCEASRYRIEAHVRNISDRIQKNRAATIRYLFKKSAIQEMLSDVEQCKSSLIIARQSIHGAISTSRHELLLHNHAELSSNSSQLLQKTSQIETVIEDVSTQQWLDFKTISRQIARASNCSTHKYQSLRDAHRESSSKISKSLCDLQNELHSQHDGNSSTIMLARIEDLQRDIHASNRHLEKLVSHRSTDNHLSSTVMTKRLKIGFQSSLFSFSVEFSSEQGSRHTNDTKSANAVPKTICAIRIPNWFVQEQHNLVIKRYQSGWLFYPSVYREVSISSPFFEACAAGDLASIKMLLTTRQAHLGGRAIKHRVCKPHSALSYAMSQGQFEACKLLVEAGILISFQSCDYVKALEDLAHDYVPNRTRDRKMLLLIEAKQRPESDWLDDLDLDCVSYKSIQDLRCNAGKVGGSALDRFEALIFPSVFLAGINCPEENLALLADFRGNADRALEIRNTASSSSCSWLLFLLAQHLNDMLRGRCSNEIPLSAFRPFTTALTAMCRKGLDLHPLHSSLSQAWRDTLRYTAWLAPHTANVTPFAYIFVESLHPYKLERNHRNLTAAVNIWAHTLYSAGVDLVAYAASEVWTIDKAFETAASRWGVSYRLSHGPEPDDWKIETSPLGEAYPVYFWRLVELTVTPILSELTERLLDIVHRVSNLDTIHCDMPGQWQEAPNEAERPKWNVEAWLAYMEDSELAQMESDLEELAAEDFHRAWNLDSVAEEWAYLKWWRPHWAYT